MKQGKRAGR